MASAETIGSSDGTAVAGSPPLFRGTPVAHEAPVIATGARPAEKSGKRELFKETTTTALVFSNGGVIRLSAAVEPGQLLFLTNQQTGREVVAQVTRRRNNASAGYYVEVDFTEPAPDFWGVAFPESSATAPATIDHPAPVELLQFSEPSSEDLSPRAPAPSADEVRALTEEVESLRAQLRSMQTQGASTNADTPQRVAPAPSPVSTPQLSALLSSVLEPAPLPQQRAAASERRANSAAGGAPTHPAERTSAPHEVAASEEALLPKPALDFQQAPARVSPADPRTAASGDRAGLLRLALLAVLSLFAVTVAAWSMHWLPWTGGPVSVPDRAPSAAHPAVSPAPSSHTRAQQNSDNHLDSSAAPQHAGNSPAQPTVTAPAGASSAPDETTSSGGSGQPAELIDKGTRRSPNEAAAAKLSVARRSVVRPAPTADLDPVSSPVDDSALVPPRVVKSVRARPPSDALRDFVTGNVTIDALIDKSGQVKSMKVLSGPPSFHKAAMEALKRYRFEPARQNGQPVSGHISVTVPFWFEP